MHFQVHSVGGRNKAKVKAKRIALYVFETKFCPFRSPYTNGFHLFFSERGGESRKAHRERNYEPG